MCMSLEFLQCRQFIETLVMAFVLRGERELVIINDRDF